MQNQDKQYWELPITWTYAHIIGIYSIYYAQDGKYCCPLLKILAIYTYMCGPLEERKVYPKLFSNGAVS